MTGVSEDNKKLTDISLADRRKRLEELNKRQQEIDKKKELDKKAKDEQTVEKGQDAESDDDTENFEEEELIAHAGDLVGAIAWATSAVRSGTIPYARLYEMLLQLDTGKVGAFRRGVGKICFSIRQGGLDLETTYLNHKYLKGTSFNFLTSLSQKLDLSAPDVTPMVNTKISFRNHMLELHSIRTPDAKTLRQKPNGINTPAAKELLKRADAPQILYTSRLLLELCGFQSSKLPEPDLEQETDAAKLLPIGNPDFWAKHAGLAEVLFEFVSAPACLFGKECKSVMMPELIEQDRNAEKLSKTMKKKAKLSSNDGTPIRWILVRSFYKKGVAARLDVGVERLQ